MKKIADAYRITELIVDFDNNFEVLQGVCSAVNNILLKHNPYHEDAMICRLYIMKDQGEELTNIIDYIKHCLKYHPNVSKLR